MSRYRKVPTKMWGDRSFRKLSGPQANGQSLFLFLFAGPMTNAVGAVAHGEAGIAEALGWSLDDFRRVFAELEAEDLARADWRSRLVFVPNFIQDNKPESPNVIRSWRASYDDLPDCDLRNEILAHLKASVLNLHKAFQEAFGEAFPEAFKQGLPEAFPEGRFQSENKPSPNQEQKQEQKQEQENPPRADARVADPSFIEFSEAFRKARKVRYGHTRADFVCLSNLRRRIGIEIQAPIPDWSRAVTNYLNTGLSKYTIADLATRFDVFVHSALDRYNKPTKGTNGGDATRVRFTPRPRPPEVGAKHQPAGCPGNPETDAATGPTADHESSAGDT